MLPSFNYSFFVIPTTKVTSAVDCLQLPPLPGLPQVYKLQEGDPEKSEDTLTSSGLLGSQRTR